MRAGAHIGLGEPGLLAALEAANRARLLLDDGSGGHEFAHDLVREVVLAGLSGARQASLHRHIGDVLEGLPQRKRQPAELAHHFLRAGESARALPYALLAGEQAEAAYAHAEAEWHFRSAVRSPRRLANSVHWSPG